jgi:hypothetical protein
MYSECGENVITSFEAKLLNLDPYDVPIMDFYEKIQFTSFGANLKQFS